MVPDRGATCWGWGRGGLAAARTGTAGDAAACCSRCSCASSVPLTAFSCSEC